MTNVSTRRLALLILLVAGCHGSSKRQPTPAPPVVGRGTPAVPKPLAIPERPISPARQPDALEDKNSLIPPPPVLADMSKPAPPMDLKVEAPPPETKPEATPIQLTKATELTAPVETTVTAPSANDRQTADPIENIRRVHRDAAAAFGKLDCFDARLTRRETINGKANPQEVIHFMFRKQPYSVRLRWLGTEGQGREVVYVDGQHGGKMHIMPTKQDSFPLPPMRMAFLPDSSTVRSKTRHDIREAGLGTAVRHLGNVLDLVARDPGQRGRLRYLGPVIRPEFKNLEGVEETILPKAEALLPDGGKRFVFFDTNPDSPSVHLPVLVVTQDSSGREVEYYCFDRVTTKIRLTDADFDPELVFKKK